MIPGLGRSPGERKGYPLQDSGLENFMDSPWGCKESDMTERLSHEGTTKDVRYLTRETRTFKRNTNVQTNAHRPKGTEYLHTHDPL